MCKQKEKRINFAIANQISKEMLNDFPKERKFKAVSDLVDCGVCGGHGYSVTDSSEIGIKQETCKECNAVGKVEKITFEEIESKPAVRIYDLPDSDLIEIANKLYLDKKYKTPVVSCNGWDFVSVIAECKGNVDYHSTLGTICIIFIKNIVYDKNNIISDCHISLDDDIVKNKTLYLIRLLQEKGVKFSI